MECLTPRGKLKKLPKPFSLHFLFEIVVYLIMHIKKMKDAIKLDLIFFSNSHLGQIVHQSCVMEARA